MPNVKTKDSGSNGLDQGAQAPEIVKESYEVSWFQSEEHDHKSAGLTDEQMLDMYRNMLLQRRFEERAAQMYGKQKIAGFLHLYIGQEAISTGSVNAMNVGSDSIITAYRDHGIGLALGMDPGACMAELFGRSTGSSRGKGGSMHYFSKDLRLFGGHGIVGAHVPVGAGIAFAHKYKKDGGVCIAYLGDGAVGQGAFHEALNLAGLYDLPIIFVIENNSYAMGTSIHRAFADPNFYRQGVAYDLLAGVVDGMDVIDVYKAMKYYIGKARQFKPSIVEIRTYRYRGHSMSDPGKYRTKEELDSMKDNDPIIRLKAYLIESGLSDNDDLDQIDKEVKEVVAEAVRFADESPLPELSEIYEHVYAENDYPFIK